MNIARRRWETFKQNKRAYVSLILFAFVFVWSLFAEFFANDKPLVVHFDDRTLFPFVQTLTETDLGGDLDILVDYKDPYTDELLEKANWVIWAPVKFSYQSINDQAATHPAPPSTDNWLGTDDHGRDILARLLYGFRLSVLFGFSLALVSSVVGVLFGLIQGYYGGWVDLIGQRLMEVWSGVPVLFLIIIISSMLTMNFWLMLLVMLLFSWMHMVGLVRAETLRARNQEYVRAARALGASDFRIMMVHVLPNALVAVIAVLPFTINGSIAALTSLDFLGFGLPATYPSLGELISQGKSNLFAPWIGLSGFFTVAFLLTTLVFIGEGLRDAFDPSVYRSQGVRRQKKTEQVAMEESV